MYQQSSNLFHDVVGPHPLPPWPGVPTVQSHPLGVPNKEGSSLPIIALCKGTGAKQEVTLSLLSLMCSFGEYMIASVEGRGTQISSGGAAGATTGKEIPTPHLEWQGQGLRKTAEQQALPVLSGSFVRIKIGRSGRRGGAGMER